jgi:Caspase domain
VTVPAAAGSRRALIVANAVYDDEGLARLVSPATDAADLARALADPRTGGYAVDALIDASATEVGAAVEDFLADRDRADLLLLYFSCHGLKDEQGRLYFAARNTRRNRLRSTAVPAGFVNELLLACRSRRKVLLLDCCYSGAFAKGMQVKADPQVHTVDQFDARGLVVLTASDATQYAFEGEQVRGSAARSAFTAALITGLDTGDADVDGDGMVSVDDAHEYLRRRLSAQPHQQNPRKWEFDVQGRIVLARAPRAAAAVPPAGLPPAILPPIQPAATAGPAASILGQPVWWAALGLVQASTALAAFLLSWWPWSWAYSAIPTEYLPSEQGSIVGVAAAGAAWGSAYAVVDAIEHARRPGPVRWYHPQRRWLHILGRVADPTGPRRFRTAALAAVPLNVFVTLVLASAIGALGYALDGSSTRDRVFPLAFTLLTAVPLGSYLRRSANSRH